MASKKTIIGDCRNCKQAGEVKDFMCFCSAYKINKSVGVRACPLFLKK